MLHGIKGKFGSGKTNKKTLPFKSYKILEDIEFVLHRIKGILELIFFVLILFFFMCLIFFLI